MKKLILILLTAILILTLTACDSGISQEDYDRVVAEHEALRAQLELEAVTSELADAKMNEVFSDNSTQVINEIQLENPVALDEVEEKPSLDIMEDDLLNLTTPVDITESEVITDGDINDIESLNVVMYGNTEGNIVNGGFATIKDDWIYYSNNGIYKMRTDGSKKALITNDEGMYLNVVGEWIYYVYSGRGYNNARQINGGIYKMRTDGTDKALLIDDYADFLHVVGEWIYYVYINPNDHKDYGIYKIRTDGTNRTWLHKASSELNIVGDWVYFRDGGISKIRTDGSEIKQVISDSLPTPLPLNVVEDWIYFYDRSETSHDLELFKIRTDNSEKTQLNSEDTYYINVVDDWIYYNFRKWDRVYEDDSSYGALIEGGIAKIRTDGSERTPLLISGDHSDFSFNVVGDWIFYSYSVWENGKREDYFCKMRTDGTEQQFVT